MSDSWASIPVLGVAVGRQFHGLCIRYYLRERPLYQADPHLREPCHLSREPGRLLPGPAGSFRAASCSCRCTSSASRAMDPTGLRERARVCALPA